MGVGKASGAAIKDHSEASVSSFPRALQPGLPSIATITTFYDEASALR